MASERDTDLTPEVQADFSQVKRLLESEGGNVNDQINGRSPLSLAVMNKGSQEVKKLLEQNADPNLLDNTDGFPPLFHANNSEIFKNLIESKANIDQEDKNGMNRLWYAVFKEDKNFVKLLLDWKADPNGITKSPLMLALQNNNGNIVQLLLKNCADVNEKKVSSEYSPLEWARNNHCSKLLGEQFKNSKIENETDGDTVSGARKSGGEFNPNTTVEMESRTSSTQEATSKNQQSRSSEVTKLFNRRSMAKFVGNLCIISALYYLLLRYDGQGYEVLHGLKEVASLIGIG